MARYYGTMQGQAGQTMRLGSPRSGLSATLNGWNGGVRVELHTEGDQDWLRLSLTCGSGHQYAAAVPIFDAPIDTEGARQALRLAFQRETV